MPAKLGEAGESSEHDLGSFGAVFSTNEARCFPELHRRLLEAKTAKGTTLKWLALGRFDHLVLELSGDPESILATERNVHQTVEASSHWGYFGRLLYPAAFDWKKTYEKYGVAGFCTIRTAETVSPLIRRDEGSRLVATLAKEFESLELEWVIGTTTGWDDYAIFLFAKSFTPIAKALGIARGLKTEQILPSEQPTRKIEMLHRHWLVTTCTVPLLRFDWNHDCAEQFDTGQVVASRESLVKQTLALIDPDEPMSWAVRFELRPGHWDGFQNELKRRCEEKDLNVEVAKVFGQVDLRCGAPNGTLGELIRFFALVAFPLVCEEDTVIRSMESHLHLPGLDYTEDKDSVYLARRRKKSDDGQDLVDADVLAKLEDFGVPQHTIESILNTFRTIEAFHHHELLEREFDTLKSVCLRFLEGVRSLEPLDEAQMRELQVAITEWLIYVDRCIADRYRGVYPTGENMMMRLGAYQASHQRFLALSDHLARWGVKTGLDCISKKRAEVGLPSNLIPEVSLATFLGNSPTPWSLNSMMRFFQAGFIDLPVGHVFHLRHSVMLAHEIGHHLTKCYLYWNKDFPVYDRGCVDRLAKALARNELEERAVTLLLPSSKNSHISNQTRNQVQRQFLEIFADLFSCCFCSKGDVRTHRKNTDIAIKHTYPGAKASRMSQSVLIEHGLRLTAVGIMIRLIRESDDSKNQLDLDAFSAAFRDNRDRSDILRAAGRVSADSETRATTTSAYISGALEIFDVLIRLPGFRAFLAGIVATGAVDVFPAPHKKPNLLEEYRELMASDVGGLAREWGFLDRAWAKIIEAEV
ncbi:MAG: hypothetical protein AAGA58_05530 [Verrucomicrobiota bacterium]